MALLKTSSLTLALLAAIAGAGLADTVIKRNGQKVEGEILEQDDKKVVIKTKFGPVEIDRADILEIETGKTSAQIFRERWEDVDKDDVLALLELADWCDENKLGRESSKVYRRVLDVDGGNERARRELGYVKHEGEWITKKELAAIEKAKRTADAKARRDAGKTKGDKAGGSRKAGDPLAGVGDVTADAKPFLDEIANNQAEDQKIATELEDFFGQRFSVATSTHFSLRCQLPPPDVAKHVALAEKIFVQTNRLFGLEPGFQLWQNPMQIVHVKQKGTFIDLVDWIDENTSEMDAETKKFFKDGGGMILSGVPLAAQYEREIPLEEAMAHWIGQTWIRYYARRAPPWLAEGFAMFTAINEFGTNRLYCSTNTKYANNIEIADKNSDSAYQLVCFDIIDGALEQPYPWLETCRKDLNSLDFADLAKSWSVVDFLMREHLDEFKTFISLLVRYEDQEQCLREAFGWTGEELDDHWKEYVEGNYSRTPPK